MSAFEVSLDVYVGHQHTPNTSHTIYQYVILHAYIHTTPHIQHACNTSQCLEGVTYLISLPPANCTVCKTPHSHDA